MSYRESTLLSLCSHPNIVEYHSSLRLHNDYFLEMEYLPTPL
jgi:serine/threonine protein kinase